MSGDKTKSRYPNGPRVDELRKKIGEIWASAELGVIFGGGIYVAPIFGLWKNMMRLTIRALDEYEAAMRMMGDDADAVGPRQLIFASTHWEGCIEATFRAVNMAEALRTHLGKFGDPKITIAKNTRFTEEVVKPLRDLRDHCQHLEQRMGTHTPKPGEGDARYGFSIYLYAALDRVMFHGSEITYQGIAEILHRLVALADWLNMQNVKPGHPLADPHGTVAADFVGADAYNRPFDGGPF